jgi:glycosyltransferase involved in cell wall biosynthesis
MKVSAVIPVYNRRDFICRAIDSIVAQTVPVDEIVIVDDGSTDGTPDIIEVRYGSKVRVVRQANGGVSKARRRGIEEATGDWIAFLDSDDEWLPERNGELVKAARTVPSEVAWIFGDLRFVTDEGETPSLFQEYGLTVAESPAVFSDSLSVQHPVLFPYLQASFIRRDVLLELKSFTEGFRSDEDVLTGFQIGCRYKFAAIPYVVGKYYRTSDLTASSLFADCNFRPDYYRARMIAYSTAIKSGRKHPWSELYATQVRGLCMLLAKDQPSPAKLAFEQFRYGAYSVKGVLFASFAIFGRPGVKLWNAIASSRRRLLRRRKSADGTALGHRRYLDAMVEKRWH